jgi:lipid-A-disaccharide synthase
MPHPPLLILAQGHAGDRLGSRLVPALRPRFPDRPLVGLGGEAMEKEGVRLIARSDGLSVMGYSGLLPKVPEIWATMQRAAAGSRQPVPALVVAVDIWQPLQYLHRFAPHLRAVPHICYLPPGPNFIGPARVHGAVSRAFRAILTPFPHQERLYREAGGHVRPAAHAGLQACRDRYHPLPAGEREPILALLPGSRALEVRYSLTIQCEAARGIRQRYPELRPVVGCADSAVEAEVRRLFPAFETTRDARDLLSRARFGLICSGTAVLEASLLGCPGVVTYHGSPLQRWEWRAFHVDKLAKLRAAGIASPYVALPNIISGEELYPECLDATAEEITAVARRELDAGPDHAAARRAAFDRVTAVLDWDDAGTVLAEECARLLNPEP